MRLRPQKRIAVAEPTASWSSVLGSDVPSSPDAAQPSHSSWDRRWCPTTRTPSAGAPCSTYPLLVFLILVVLCARSSAAELDDLARWRGGRTAGSAMRMVVTGLGYAICARGHAVDVVDPDRPPVARRSHRGCRHRHRSAAELGQRLRGTRTPDGAPFCRRQTHPSPIGSARRRVLRHRHIHEPHLRLGPHGRRDVEGPQFVGPGCGRRAMGPL